MIEADLAKASAAVSGEDWKAALESLLVAWRLRRIERLAALIDRVSLRLPAAPIKGKTVKARTEAWLEVAKKEDPADVGALIATPWPGKWQDGLAVLEAYDSFQSDPRIALTIATFAVTAPFDSRASMKFYEVSLRILGKCRDPRTKPLLEAELERKGSHWYEQVKRICESTLDAMGEIPALEPAEEAALAKIEALFASEVRTEATNEKSEADFLAAIYAAPDDDALRAVFADWLTERGDPRGEFITLQLTADDANAKAKKREASLLKKHGAAWAGALDRPFSNDRRIWTRGFLTGGVVYDQEDLTKELAHPEWALIDTLYVASFRGVTPEALLAAPWLKNLRSLTGVSEAMIAKMADGALGPNLEEIQMLVADENHLEGDERRRIARGFPRLKRLGVGYDDEATLRYIAGPLPPLESLLLISQRLPLAQASRIVRPDVPMIEARDSFGTHSQWRFELHRDAQGRFTRLRAGPCDPTHSLPGARQLNHVIKSLPELEELVVEPGAGVDWGRDSLANVEASLAAAKNLRVIDVPWDRDVGPMDAGAPRLKLHCRSRVGMATELDVVWNAMTSAPLALEFDSFTVNYGTHLPLVGDALANVKTLLEKKRTHSVAVYRKKTAETMNVVIRDTYFELTIPRGPDFDLDAWLTWLVALLDRTQMSVVAAPFLNIDDGGAVRERYMKRVGPQSEPLRWLMGFCDEKQYTFDDLSAVAARCGVRVVRSQRNLLLIFGDAPDLPMTDEAQIAFDTALTDAYWKQYERTRGFTPERLVASLLGTALIERGFAAEPKSTWTRGGASVILQKRLGSEGDVALEAELRRADGHAHVTPITQTVVATKALATSALEAFVMKLDTMLAWLDAPRAAKFPRA